MENRIIYVILFAIIPSVLLITYIYKKDRKEKEPIGLLSALFLCGAVSFIPFFYLRKLSVNLMESVFSGKITYSVEGVAQYNSNLTMILYEFCSCFICMGLLAELIKWFVLLLITKNNKNFNSLFDGIIYSVFVSLGFGIAESVRYAVVDGADSLPLRLATLIPCCFFYGIIMGLFYTLWHTRRKAFAYEQKLYKNNKIEVCLLKNTWFYLLLSLVIPSFIHGFYEYSSNSFNTVVKLLFYALVIILYGICFFVTFLFSKEDNIDNIIAKQIIAKCHPDLSSNEEDNYA